jgi:hypothetical protein
MIYEGPGRFRRQLLFPLKRQLEFPSGAQAQRARIGPKTARTPGPSPEYRRGETWPPSPDHGYMVPPSPEYGRGDAQSLILIPNPLHPSIGHVHSQLPHFPVKIRSMQP